MTWVVYIYILAECSSSDIVQDMCEEGRAGSDNAGVCVVDTSEIMRTAAVMSNIPGSGRCISCAVLSNFENVAILFMN